MAHRNAKGGGSIRQRPDGRWEGRYSLGFDPKTGHQRQRSVYGKTQAEVRKKLSKIVVEIDEGTYVCPTKMTLAQWLQTWLEDYTINVKPFTKKAYEDRCRLYIIPNLGRVKLAALTPTMIQRFINSLSVDRDGQKALAPKTIKNIHGVLHRALWQAEILGYLKNNPADNCLLPKVVKPPITPLTDKSLVDFIEVASESKYGDIFLIDLYTGLRQSEILGLTWDCVSFETGIITVKAQLQREKKKGGKYYLTSLKNDKTRYVAAARKIGFGTSFGTLKQ